MKQNIGILNALIRITLGFVALSCSTAKLTRKPWCTWSKVLLWLGAMKIAEGILRFCPITEACKLGKYMNFGAVKIPSMDFTKKGHAKQEEVNHTSSPDAQQSKGSYDASDKEIESAIEEVILAKPL
ncbi:YgaP family membrane protein [Bacillus sp. C1]